jgi:hypothetical protein
MPASPRRPQPSILALLAIIACRSERTPDDAGPVAVPPRDAAPRSENKITITVEKPRAPGSGLAQRCAIAGDPIASECRGNGGLAIRDRLVYVTGGAQIHRYKLADGDGCRLEPAGAAIVLPPEKQRAQTIGKGPLYMRGGGPDWHLASVGNALYALDFLGGLYRLDKDALVPACVDEFGYDSVASWKGALVVVRNGIEQLAPGGKCKARATDIDAKARGDLYAIRDRLYIATRGGTTIARYDGTAKAVLGEGARICSVVGLVPCGDGICAVDNNCMQVVQLDKDGAVLRTIEDRKLFETRPYSLHTAAAATDGSVYVLARHRDKAGGSDVCEAAVYRMPAALFAL